jgi:hypothetical protein
VSQLIFRVLLRVLLVTQTETGKNEEPEGYHTLIVHEVCVYQVCNLTDREEYPKHNHVTITICPLQRAMAMIYT